MGITCWLAIVVKGSGTSARNMKLIATSLAFAILATSGLAAPSPAGEKNARALAVFSVVQFENTDCTAIQGSTVTGNTGKCFATSECAPNGGTVFGNCAAGFGVCCVFGVAACGGTVNRNSTYISNLGYNYASTTVSGITTAGACTYTINYASTDICQLRLDFQNFNLNRAATDSFAVTGPTSSNPPTITGLNTGRHMYVETSRQTTATSIVVTTVGTANTRSWNVRVDQIECDNLNRAPSGCVQYFTASSGTVTSYNWRTATQQELASQNYALCIRQAAGNCAIQYSQTTTAPSSFILGSNIATALAAGCNAINGGLSIPRAVIGTVTTFDGTLCQSPLNLVTAATTASSVTQTPPFILRYVSQASIANTAGFSLDYAQQGC